MNQNVRNFKRKLERKVENLEFSKQDILDKIKKLEHRLSIIETDISDTKTFLELSDEEINSILQEKSQKGRRSENTEL